MTHDREPPGAPDRVGLCIRCRHGRPVPTPNAVYWLCERAAREPAFERYPRLPVLGCPGFEAGDSDDPRSGG